MSEPKSPESEPTTVKPPTTASTGSPAASPASSPKPATGTGPKAPAPSQPAKTGRQRKEEAKAHDPLRGSRSSGFYASVVALGIVLILLIIFIAQNTQKTTVNFLGWSGGVSVAVALLIAAAAGLFLALIASSLRILQLRRRVKRDRKAAA